MHVQHINPPINQNFSIATHQQETTIESYFHTNVH